MRKPLLPIITLSLALLAAGCGGSSSPASKRSQKTLLQYTRTGRQVAGAPVTGVQLTAKSLSGLGPVVIDSTGRTLYTFTSDNDKTVTCTGRCALVWPPLTVAAGAKPTAGSGLDASMIGTLPGPKGSQVVTYDGWPLYMYVADDLPGDDGGQAAEEFGGGWFTISPTGTVIKKRAP